ncbi:D-alanyl-D-alanine carboxypeptidase [Schaalia sp. ZJ1691]|uniref:D-alanyl-D-alanine carboxypeptidase n=1 Tax=Schaalia sp. ZJ1691 TaxID=2709404 RepID=UPI0013E9D8C6|nr:D-alanyl-D-alanine carboxypeptidase [Schaalia sp. ZJ1691]
MRQQPLGVIVSALAVALVLVGCHGADVRRPEGAPSTISRDVDPRGPATILPQSGAALPAIKGSEDGAAVSPQAVAALWSPVQNAADQGHWVTWGSVIDASTGDVLLDRSAQTSHAPGSVAKVLTAFTALSHLRASDRLTTGVKQEGTSLYLWGEGDLMLAAGAGTRTAVNGHAGVADLAQATAAALKKQGIDAVTVNWQENPFAGPSRLPALVEQEVADYEGPVAAMGMNSGALDATFIGFTATPEADVADVFVRALEEGGVKAQLGQRADAPEGASSIASVESATMGQQIRWMLHYSDNTLADQYCRLAARAAGGDTSFEGATGLVRSTLTSAAVPIDGLRLDDCSGLSEDNRITAATLVNALRTAALSTADTDDADADDAGPASHRRVGTSDLIRDLPWSGLQGTMTKRMLPEGIANVQAKTGSLAATSTLAGTVTTSSGRTLIFAIGNDQVPDDGAYFTRDVLDSFIQGLAKL